MGVNWGVVWAFVWPILRQALIAALVALLALLGYDRVVPSRYWRQVRPGGDMEALRVRLSALEDAVGLKFGRKAGGK
jgi:hypothetical protein